MAPHAAPSPRTLMRWKRGHRLRVGLTQSPGPVTGNLGGRLIHVHDRASCTAAVLAHVHTRSGPRKPGSRVTPEARACCVGDLALTPARPTARPRRGKTSSLLRLDSDSDGHTKPRPEPEPSRDTRVGPAECCATATGQRGDRLSSHPLPPGSPTRMGLVLGTPAAATNTARAGPRDMTPISRWTAPQLAGRLPRYRVPSVRPVGPSQPAPHGTKNLEAKTDPVTGKVQPRAAVQRIQRPGRGNSNRYTVQTPTNRRQQSYRFRRQTVASQASASSQIFSPCPHTPLLVHPFPTHLFFYGFLTGAGHRGQRHRHRPPGPQSRSRHGHASPQTAQPRTLPCIASRISTPRSGGPRATARRDARLLPVRPGPRANA
jgi:hypothetical protein